MAKKTRPNIGLPIGLGIGAIAIVAGGAWLWRDAQNAAKADAAIAAYTPRAPEGRLLLVREGVTEARLLVLDELKPTPTGAEATVVLIGKSPTGLEAKSAMIIQRKTFDCGRQRVFDGKVGLFDHDGRLTSTKTLYSGRRGRLIDTEEVEAGMICAGAAALKGRTYQGFRAAQREMQSMPQGYAEIADRRPEDGAAWAWVCNAAARGTWRDQSPQDCDRAVRLNSDTASVRLDRAFLNLIIGKQAAAMSDFEAVVAKEPDNARALFARGLILALRGDQAASRRDRAKALALDPNVPSWIQATYGLRVGAEYRTP